MAKRSIERVLGFDFGLARIGVASGQCITCTATPVTILPAKDGIPQWEMITALLDAWRPDALIVGLPLNNDGSESDMCHRARKFGNRLGARYKKPIRFVNEYLTTKDARAQLELHKGKRKAQEARIDSIAAVLILENWFDLKDNGDNF